jgi:hypothetical protein
VPIPADGDKIAPQSKGDGMRLKTCLAGALIVLFAAAAVAQDMDPKMMEAMMKAATPGEPHKKLSEFAGTWNTKLSMWMAPGAPPMSTEGTTESKLIMGGRYLEQRFNGNFMGMPFEGIGYTGYDNIRKQYWGTWMDNMSTVMMSSTGWSPDPKTYMFTGSMPDPMTAKETRMEERITIKDANNHLLEMWGPAPDGTMYKMMEITYSRKK